MSVATSDFVDEPGERANGQFRRIGVDDRGDVVDGHRAGERGERGEQVTFVVGEEVFRPGHERSNRAVPVVGGAVGRPEEIQPLAEQVGEVDRTDRRQPGRRHLDREREPVEAGQEPSDRGFLVVGPVVVGRNRLRPIEQEQPRRLIGERGDRPDPFVRHREPFATRGHEADAPVEPQDRCDQPGGLREHVFAVVEHHHGIEVGDRRDEGALIVADDVVESGAAPQRVHDTLRVADRCELHDLHAVGPMFAAPAGRLERERGLADTTGADEGHEPGTLDEFDDTDDVGIAAQQSGRGGSTAATDRRVRVVAIDRGDEPISAPAEVLHHFLADTVVTERLPNLLDPGRER